MTTDMSVSSSEFAVTVAYDSDPMTLSHLTFSCLLFAVCVDYNSDMVYKNVEFTVHSVEWVSQKTTI